MVGVELIPSLPSLAIGLGKHWDFNKIVVVTIIIIIIIIVIIIIIIVQFLRYQCWFWGIVIFMQQTQ